MKELAAVGARVRVPAAVTCRVLKLHRQHYYAWLAEPVTDADWVAAHRANAIFDAHRDDPQFGNVAYPHALERARTGTRILVAPIQTDPRRWMRGPWQDRDNADKPPVRIRTGDPGYAVKGATAVQSFRDYYEIYADHPEGKTVASDGGPCQPDTRGLLLPPTIVARGHLIRLGKESNRLTDDTDLANPEDEPVVYPRPTCRGCNTEVRGRRHWCGEPCRKRTERARPKVR